MNQNNSDRQEAERQSRERYLATVVTIQHQLLSASEVRSCYPGVLELLGNTAGASRVYIFENHRDHSGRLLMSQKAEWCAPGIAPEIDNPVLQNLAYDNFFARWSEALAKGEVIAGKVAQFPDEERAVLEPQNILSILVLPFLVNEEFLGFIGFDNCLEAQPWEESEVVLLKAVAAAISLSLERNQAKQALEYRVELEHLVTNISTQFIHLSYEQIDWGINSVLEQIGKFAQVDRSYVFQMVHDNTTISNTHEWCADGVDPQIARLQNIPQGRFSWLMTKLGRFEAVCITRVEALPPEASAEKEEFLAESIQSLLCIPLVSQGLLLGFMGLDSVRLPKQWTDNSVKLLNLIGEIVVSALERQRTETELEQYRHQLEALVSTRTAALEREIAQRKRIEQQLFQEKELAQVTLHSIGDGAIAADAEGRIDYLNPVAEKLTGWTLETARGLPLERVFTVVNEATRQLADNPVSQALSSGRAASVAEHSVLIACNGKEYGIDGSASPIRDRGEQIIGAVLVFRDVTHSRQLAQKLSWQASHDALTGLVNRLEFEQAIVKALQSVKHEQPHILCYLDLDQFKAVNDIGGHLAGDELLKQVSALIQSRIRSTDTLARLGGDEFGILLYQCPLEQAQNITDELREAVYNFRFVWEDKTFSVGVSIGLVALDSHHTLEEVLSAADAACYAAKETGRNRVHIYRIHDSEVDKQRNKRLWSVRIRQALKDNRFCLYQQAIVPTNQPAATDRHVEVLLRMLDQEGGLILPSAFIPAAERYDLMPALDRWVVCAFLVYFEQIQERHLPDTPALYSINLSGLSVSDEQFVNWLKQKLSHSFATRSICFEITETTAISNFNQVKRFMDELKKLGCRFALDDFGSGMSSFAYLRNLPVDYLKIDGRLIKEMAADSTAYAIVESINHIGQVIGVKTIAEFVSTPSIRKPLETIGVDYVQGFGIAMPEPLSN